MRKFMTHPHLSSKASTLKTGSKLVCPRMTATHNQVLILHPDGNALIFERTFYLHFMKQASPTAWLALLKIY
jgi:hypothetical protein